MRRNSTALLALALVGCRTGPELAAPPAPAVSASGAIDLADFAGEGGVLDSERWRLERFAGVAPTVWEVRRDGDRPYLRGRSEASAAMLVRPVSLDPRAHRRFAWRWRIDSLPVAADLRRRAGDDSAARVFVLFAHEPSRATVAETLARSLLGRPLPGSALCYVWARRVPAGDVLPNAFVRETRMVVLETGRRRAGVWRAVERDVVRDYERAFGRGPPRVVGIAVLVDTDQTKGKAAADFADFAFRR